MPAKGLDVVDDAVIEARLDVVPLFGISEPLEPRLVLCKG